MNLMQRLNSFDELLFEVLSWLIFFPVTLWRVLRHPLSMMAYAETQLALPDDDQYGDTVSPPIFLVLSLLISQALELALTGINAIVLNRHGLAGLVDDNTSLLLFRLILFGVFPLLMATRLVRKRGAGLDRKTLKPAFYAQCYLAAPFALCLGLGATMVTQPWDWARFAGTGTMAVTLLLYGIVQTRWFATQLAQSHARLRQCHVRHGGKPDHCDAGGGAFRPVTTVSDSTEARLEQSLHAATMSALPSHVEGVGWGSPSFRRPQR